VRALLAAFVVLAVVIYGGWHGMLATQHYLRLADFVNETVQRELPSMSDGWQPADRAFRIRESILRSAPQSGLGIDPASVAVSETARVLAVRVTSSYTIARYEETVLAVPIRASRSFRVPSGSR
jgi:hypothetical protein